MSGILEIVDENSRAERKVLREDKQMSSYSRNS